MKHSRADGRLDQSLPIVVDNASESVSRLSNKAASSSLDKRGPR